MDRILEWEEEIRQRCIKQNIDVTDCYILFNIGSSFYFAGEKITGISESKDRKWICIPIHDEDAEECFGEYIFKPQCFEVRLVVSTYLSTGSMIKLVTIWCLEKN